MATTPVFTYQDIAEHVWHVMNPANKPPTGRELRVAKIAVVSAYRDLANRHDWNYYKRRATIATEAPYTTGTITYDHTGGTYERELTLADGVWPANAARGVVVINDKHYPVESRKSDTVCTLSVNINPSVDIASGTSYTWYRDAYPLPVNFRRLLSSPIESISGGDTVPLTYLEPGSHLYTTRHDSGHTTDDPEWYTIANHGDYIGGLSIVFGRAPASAKTYDLMYQVSPRELRTYKEAAGTISIDAGTVVVTGSGTSFSSFHQGSVIRFTESTETEPTSVVGNVNGDDNPYIAQRVVQSVSGQSLLGIDVQVSASNSLSGCKFTISDPVDVEPIVMRTPLEMLALFHFARLTKRKDATTLEQDAEKAILYAMEQDNRTAVVHSGTLQDLSSTNTWGSVDVVPDS